MTVNTPRLAISPSGRNDPIGLLDRRRLTVNTWGMSTETSERIPTLTLGWRLKMSLGDMKAEDMADQLGVSRQTLSRWMGDKGAPPKRAYLMQWALATNTSVEWLTTGVVTTTPQPEGEPTTPSSALDRLASKKRARHAGMPVTPRYAAA